MAIFGDYDVDGACSAALLSEYLSACGLETIVHIPDRVTEGYGPNAEAIQDFAARGATLVVTVDCGAVSREPFELASRLGLDVIVFDHHQAPETLPRTAALVDPNREDDLSGLGYLCAAGVVFMALVALNRALREAGFWAEGKAPDLMAALDLVALATVADVVPLVGLNRAFVVKGLAVMRERRPAWACRAVRRRGRRRTAAALPFELRHRPAHQRRRAHRRRGARRPAAHRGRRHRGARDRGRARPAEPRPTGRSRSRRWREAEAEALLALGLEERGAAVVVAGETWPPGVVGLLAARLKERFERPAFALSLAGGHATGSGRSIPGVDLGRAVRAAIEAGVAIKGGGHAMAAGVTLASERLGDWRAFLEERLGDAVMKARAGAGLRIDAALTANAATPELVRRLEAAGPFGAGAPEPVFALPRHGWRRRRRSARAASICACARSRATGGRSRGSRSAPRARSSARR